VTVVTVNVRTDDFLDFREPAGSDLLGAEDDAGGEAADAEHQLHADVAPERRGVESHDRRGTPDARVKLFR
jgi:hypothetical protein